MRLALRTMVIGAAALICTAGGAAAKAPQEVRVHARIVRGPWSATVKPFGALQTPQDVEPDITPAMSANALAFVSGSTVYAYSKTAAGWSSATPGTYSLPERQTDEPRFTMAAGNGLIAFAEADPFTPVAPGGCAGPVFTAGSAGFSGAMTPAACLAFPTDGSGQLSAPKAPASAPGRVSCRR